MWRGEKAHTGFMAVASDPILRRIGLGLFGAVVLLDLAYVLLTKGLEGRPGLSYPTEVEVGTATLGMAPALVGLMLVWARPRNSIGWLIGGSGLALVALNATQAYGARALVVPEQHLPLGTWALALFSPLWIATLAIPVTMLLVRYPSGRIDGRWPRRFDRLAVLGYLPLYVGYATSHHAVTDVVRDAVNPILLPEPVSGGLAVLGAGVILLCAAAIVVDAIRRAVRSAGPERKALVLLLGAAVLAVVLIMLGPVEWLGDVAYAGLLATVAVGVLRYGALGIELTVLYGDRNDPFATLNRLGAPLGAAVDDRSLPDLLARLVEALGVDGAAVEGPISARAGILPERPTRVPLSFGGEDLGRLLVGHRSSGAASSAADRRLAEAVAPLLSAVLHAVRLAEQLRDHQARVIQATQAERRRLRQELHDGLGPSLTGIGLGLEALAPTVPDGELVARLRSEVASSLEDTRRIIDDLRPSALDGTDLASAVRRRVEQVSSTGALAVTLDAPEALPGLPPPVAAAAFRVTEEALSNVVRHARASRCTIALRIDGDLVLEVTDDGVGPGNPRPDGVGLTSMRERTERLGGQFLIEGAASGTVVRARFPLVGEGAAP